MVFTCDWFQFDFSVLEGRGGGRMLRQHALTFRFNAHDIDMKVCFKCWPTPVIARTAAWKTTQRRTTFSTDWKETGDVWELATLLTAAGSHFVSIHWLCIVALHTVYSS